MPTTSNRFKMHKFLILKVADDAAIDVVSVHEKYESASTALKQVTKDAENHYLVSATFLARGGDDDTE